MSTNRGALSKHGRTYAVIGNLPKVHAGRTKPSKSPGPTPCQHIPPRAVFKTTRGSASPHSITTAETASGLALCGAVAQRLVSQPRGFLLEGQLEASELWGACLAESKLHSSVAVIVGPWQPHPCHAYGT